MGQGAPIVGTEPPLLALGDESKPGGVGRERITAARERGRGGPGPTSAPGPSTSPAPPIPPHPPPSLPARAALLGQPGGPHPAHLVQSGPPRA